MNLPGCAGCQHGNSVSQRLQQALTVGRRLLNLCYAVNGLGRTRLSPCLVKDVDSSSTDSVLSKHGSPVCSPAIYVYLIQNVFAFGFSVCIYSSMHLPGKKPALGECGIYCNSSPGMVFNTFQFYYLNSGYWIFKAL